MQFLADENIPGSVVKQLRDHGHDVTWACESFRGSTDANLLQIAQKEGRVVITFDRDFGELAFRHKLPAQSGIVLFRVMFSNSEKLSSFVVSILESRSDWSGNFAVIEETHIRITPIPT